MWVIGLLLSLSFLLRLRVWKSSSQHEPALGLGFRVFQTRVLLAAAVVETEAQAAPVRAATVETTRGMATGTVARICPARLGFFD